MMKTADDFTSSLWEVQLTQHLDLTESPLKQMGMEDWCIEHMMEFYCNAMELYNIHRAGSRITIVVEQITVQSVI